MDGALDPSIFLFIKSDHIFLRTFLFLVLNKSESLECLDYMIAGDKPHIFFTVYVTAFLRKH